MNTLNCKLILIFALFFFFGKISAQLVVNNGALIAIKDNATVIVKSGSVNNLAGTIDNQGLLIIEGLFENNDTANGGSSDGIYRVEGDWINNATFIADSSQVELFGANQLIAGTSVTEFHRLTLTGTGIKRQTINSRVNSLLELNNLELATDANDMLVLNPDLNAITRSTGFVSSLGNGRLVREMANAGNYLFPTGSSIGTPRYRPIILTTSNSLNNTFGARLANVDATTENFDRSNKENALCDINPQYYHLLRRTQGNDPVNITKHFDPNTERNWTQIAHWQNTPQWENVGAVTQGNNAGFRTLTIVGWNDFNLEPFAFAIPSPDVALGISKVKQPSCFGLSDGSIEIDIFSGTPPFTFIWEPNQESTQNIFDLPAGTYTVFITDSNGCTDAVPDAFELINPDEIVLTASTTEVSCAGGNDGAIDLTISDFNTSITNIEWTRNAGNTEDISGLDAGDYTVVVTDFNECQKTGTFTVIEPSEIIANIDARNISCFGINDGEATVDVTGGVPNYSFLWSNNETTQTITNLDDGTVSVVVTDLNGCTFVTTSSINRPDSLSADITSSEVFFGEDTIVIASGREASITATVIGGGTPGFTFEWTPADGLNTVLGSTVVANPVTNTEYTVSVIDDNGCVTQEKVYVRVDSKLFDFPSGFTPNGQNEINRNFGIIASPVVELIELRIFNRWGEQVFRGSGNNAKWNGVYKGDLQPMDTYIYQAQVQLPDGSRVNSSGNVILIW